MLKLHDKLNALVNLAKHLGSSASGIWPVDSTVASSRTRRTWKWSSRNRPNDKMNS